MKFSQPNTRRHLPLVDVNLTRPSPHPRLRGWGEVGSLLYSIQLLLARLAFQTKILLFKPPCAHYAFLIPILEAFKQVCLAAACGRTRNVISHAESILYLINLYLLHS